MSLTGKYLQSKIYIVPWQRIEVISGPVTSMPSSLSNVMPDDSTMNGNATAGDRWFCHLDEPVAYGEQNLYSYFI